MKKILLLLVEDDFYIRDVYKKTFEKAGYDVDIAIDGSEALEKSRDHRYDVILLDIMLPRLNGLMVLKSIRSGASQSSSTPVFLLTNLGQENIIQEAFKIGADGYLLKAQQNPQTVVSELQKFIDQYQSKSESGKAHEPHQETAKEPASQSPTEQATTPALEQQTPPSEPASSV